MCVVWWALFLIASIGEVAFGRFSPAKLGDFARWRGKEALLAEYLAKTERMRLTCVGAMLACTVAFSVVASFGTSDMTSARTRSAVEMAFALGAFSVVVSLLMVGRVLARAIAMRFAEEIVSRSMPTLYPISVVVTPFLRFRTGVDRLLFARDTSASAELADAIRSVVDNGEEVAPLGETERRMIQRIVEIRNVEVREIMTPRTEVVGVRVAASLEEARRIALETRHTRLPVYGDTLDNVVGILNVKDLIGRPGWETAKLSEIMRKPRFIPETKKVGELFEELRARRTHVAIVVDEYGGTAGLVTIEDILEEIVGEIEDEYDIQQKGPMDRIDESTIEVDAKVRVSELNDILSINIPEGDDFDTVGGFVFSHLGRIPRVGERFAHENVEITVLDASERRILRLLLRTHAHAPRAESS
jgi:magnesium and cobalt transporter